MIKTTSYFKKSFKKPKRDKIESIVTNETWSIDKYFRKIPPEVYDVLLQDAIDNHRGFTTTEAWERRKAAVLKYPKHFKWETKYNNIPQSVHDAFKKEVLGYSFEEFIINTEDEVEYNNKTGGGLLAQIQKEGANHSYSDMPLTLEVLYKWIEDARKYDFERLEQKRKEREREVEIWNKHYGPYGLEYRD